MCLLVHHVIGTDCEEMIQLARKDPMLVYSRHTGTGPLIGTAPLTDVAAPLERYEQVNVIVPVINLIPETSLIGPSFDTSPNGLTEGRIEDIEGDSFTWNVVDDTNELKTGSMDLFGENKPASTDRGAKPQNYEGQSEQTSTAPSDIDIETGYNIAPLTDGKITDEDDGDVVEGVEEAMKDTLACRYYLRLVVECGAINGETVGRTKFNTAEVFFYYSDGRTPVQTTYTASASAAVSAKRSHSVNSHQRVDNHDDSSVTV